MIFAVFDPSPLTVCIDCSFFKNNNLVKGDGGLWSNLSIAVR